MLLSPTICPLINCTKTVKILAFKGLKQEYLTVEIIESLKNVIVESFRNFCACT